MDFFYTAPMVRLILAECLSLTDLDDVEYVADVQRALEWVKQSFPHDYHFILAEAEGYTIPELASLYRCDPFELAERVDRVYTSMAKYLNGDT